MRWIIIKVIKLYQYTISPFLGNHCRFYPSCSKYAIDALQQYGFFYGIWLAFCRLLKCHPGTDGGFDPVPNVPPLKKPAPHLLRGRCCINRNYTPFEKGGRAQRGGI